MPVITLHKAQSSIINYLFSPLKELQLRFCPVVAARGFGKTFLSCSASALALGELERLDISVPNKNIAILCGSHSQATDLYWPVLAYQFGLESHSIKSSRRDGTFEFANGTRIKTWSADAYERLRGSGQYLVVGDEMPSWSVPGGSIQDAWESVIQPTILTRWDPKSAARYGAPSAGRAVIPSTPRGKDYFYELAEREHIDHRWKTFRYTYKDSPYLNQEEIEAVKHYYDKMKFAREYLASFEESGLNVFYAFSRKKHVKELPKLDEHETVHCAIDFNIMINATSFHTIRGDQLHCIGEHSGSADTEELARYIRSRFPRNKIVCYPDPSGTKRVTSAPIGRTDFTILREAGFTVLAPAAAPSIVDSVAAVNRKLENAAGIIDFFIDPGCTKVISSLERTVWLESRPETATIDKTAGVEHFSDGIRYLVNFLWPITSSRPALVQTNFF